MHQLTDPSTSSTGQPFFIVGCPRSGTTLLSVLMARHSRIAVTPETAFYDDTAAWPWPCDRSTLSVLLSEWPRLAELSLDADRVAAFCPPLSTAGDVFTTLLALYAEAMGKPVCGEKTPQHLRHTERILGDFPSSRVFCLVRDGYDTALSLNAMPWWRSDLSGAARCWLEAVEQAERMSDAHPHRFAIVRYERLVTEPEDTLATILRDLDLAFEPRQLVADAIDVTGVILPRSLSWKGNAACRVDRERIGARLADASEADIALLDGMLGAKQNSLGYNRTDQARTDSEAELPRRDPTGHDTEHETTETPPQRLPEGSRLEIGRHITPLADRPHPLRLDRAGSSPGSAPRLTVSILTRDAADRLPRLIDEVSCFAHEIIVGVDAASTDETLKIAADLADKVYRFTHPPGQLAGARMLIFRYASGDWILSLDDDESISDGFDTILSELMDDPTITNYWFPRQWIVDRAAFTFVKKPPWFPDWQLRLFRNDESLVWKPAWAHSGYNVQGLSRLEERAVIHHLEPVLLDADARSRKLALYRMGRSHEASEAQYVPLTEQMPRVCAVRRRGVAPRPRGQAYAALDHEIQEPPIRSAPRWGCRILSVDISQTLKAGDDFAAQVRARNTGFQTWMPSHLSRRGSLIYLTYHLLKGDGEMLEFENPRFPVPKPVRPGEVVSMIVQGVTPATPGPHILEWTFVSEGECWFDHVGSPVYRTHLEVV